MIQALIFDFDGVILESAELKTEAFEQLAKEEFPAFVKEVVAYHRKNMGISRFVKFRYVFDNLLKKKLTPEIEKRLGERFTAIVFENLKTVPFVKGSLEFLKSNRGKYKMFVASGTPEGELKEVAALRGVSDYFNELHGSPRTKRDIVLDILARYNLEPREAVFVGDAESDYLAAKLTGVPFVGRVHDGQLSDCDCLQIQDLSDLEKILTQMR
ncbi:MAG: hypothetical protein A2351_05625 [Omnitrophica bacterium RIFOXYB12_FULL_50_7]|nr:MAG: hypothetical protein A2351_05625 [Omnitrophica bacterium RIFOXYB12_FULL_50_7]